MQVKKIFLASSEELKDDRRSFELMLSRLNPQWRPRNLTFDLVVWENFIDAMSKEGLQKEYNKAVEDCDIFVMLFFTKVGRYTLEEFETAFTDLNRLLRDRRSRRCSGGSARRESSLRAGTERGVPYRARMPRAGSLIATSRSSLVSRARKTSPIPPRPMSSTS